MRQRTYRTLLGILVGLVLLNLPTLLMPLFTRRIELNPILVLGILGFGLLPVSVAGLWRDRPWGLAVAVLASVLVLLPHARQGLMEVMAMGSCHFIVLALATIRFLTRKKQTSAPRVHNHPTRRTPRLHRPSD